MTEPDLADRIAGGIIGSAIGDAFGAPYECKDYRDIRRYFGDARTFADLEEVYRRMPDADFSPVIACMDRKPWRPIGLITDDTVLSDLLLDCILEHDGEVTAIEFAEQWKHFEDPVENPDGDPVVRLNRVHWIERIPYLRNNLHEIPKRELGHGEANATNAIMYIAPVGLLCAGDPAMAELMAVDVSSVNQHGRSRDPAGGYAAALAACFVPGMTVEEIVRLGVHHTHDPYCVHQLEAMLDVARKCDDCATFIERYYEEIIDDIIPYRDVQAATDARSREMGSCVSWISTEVLGPVLATFLITGGKDVEEMVLACARIGRDADTICRAAGGLIGAWRGLSAFPAEWRETVLAKNRWLRMEEKSARLASLVERRIQTRADRLHSLLPG